MVSDTSPLLNALPFLSTKPRSDFCFQVSANLTNSNTIKRLLCGNTPHGDGSWVYLHFGGRREADKWTPEQRTFLGLVEPAVSLPTGCQHHPPAAPPTNILTSIPPPHQHPSSQSTQTWFVAPSLCYHPRRGCLCFHLPGKTMLGGAALVYNKTSFT